MERLEPGLYDLAYRYDGVVCEGQLICESAAISPTSEVVNGVGLLENGTRLAIVLHLAHKALTGVWQVSGQAAEVLDYGAVELSCAEGEAGGWVGDWFSADSRRAGSCTITTRD